MIKKIKLEELKIGMYIHDFNCGWLNHPFLSNSLLVSDEGLIKKAADYGIRELYIDTDKGYDLAGAPTAEAVKQKIQTEINRVAQGERVDRNPVPYKEEFIKATEIKEEAKKTIHNIMEEVRFGRQIETEKVEHVVDNMIESIFRNQDALVSLALLKKVDEYTYMHSVSVCVLMISFGKSLGFGTALLKDVGVGAILHDIGKMIVPQSLLNKEDKLTDEELKLMQKHVEFSRMLLEQTKGVSEIAMKVAAQHHERVDGTGYPSGLKGDEISYYAKAVAIADVYDAMTSRRCYQNRFLPTDVLRRLYEWSSYHYDKDLVQQFIRCVGIYPIGTLVRLKSGNVAVVLKHGEKSLLHPVVRVVYNVKTGRFPRMPFDIDLANPTGKSAGEKIESDESPERLGIKPELYM